MSSSRFNGNIQRDDVFSDIFGSKRPVRGSAGSSPTHQQPPLDLSNIPLIPSPSSSQSSQQKIINNIPPHLQPQLNSYQQQEQPVTLDPTKSDSSSGSSEELRYLYGNQKQQQAAQAQAQRQLNLPVRPQYGPQYLQGQANLPARPQQNHYAQQAQQAQQQQRPHNLPIKPQTNSHMLQQQQQQPQQQQYIPQNISNNQQRPVNSHPSSRGGNLPYPNVQQQQQQQHQYNHPQPQPPPVSTTNTLGAIPERYNYSENTSPLHHPTNNRSPVLRQSFNFFNRSTASLSQRSVSTSAVNSELRNSNNFQNNGNNNRAMSLSSTSHDRYHQHHKPTTTASGRTIPQKVDVSDTNINNGNNTYSHSSNGNSSPGLNSKSRSFSSLTTKVSKRTLSQSSQSNLKNTDRSYSSSSLTSKTVFTSSSRRPSVYPALLSRVARLFKERIVLGSKLKNGLEYRDAFSGSEAVDIISHIIRTSDRNLALLLGRALDAQKFFHDVTYEHRLRDSNNEVYQFNDFTFFNQNNTGNGTQTNLNGNKRNSFNSENTLNNASMLESPSVSSTIHQLPSSASINQQVNNGSSALLNQQDILVNGVFTLLTECYSPTCTRDRLCYSIACPRRLEQQARLNLKPQGGLRRNDTHISLHENDEKKHLWSYSVPKSVLESVDKRELKRQESIFETIYTERDFVKDLEYIRDFWIRPLRESNIIPEREREKFIKTVFSGVNEILAVNGKLAAALTRRQNKKSIVDQIGDIFLQYIPHFEPFVYYGAGQIFGKYEFERQKTTNPLFARFVEETERLKESRRLDLSSFLSKPTSRPARYPLLLKAIRDHTREDSPDYENLNKALALLQKLLDRINIETGKSSDRYQLILLKQKLQFRPGEFVDLKLTTPNRRILYHCVLKKRNYQDKENQGEVQAYLFDHALLFVKIKIVNKREQHRVYQRPIPLQLLLLSVTEEVPNLKTMMKRSSAMQISALSSASSLVASSPPSILMSSSTSLNNGNSNSNKFPVTFSYLGRKGDYLTLYAPKLSIQKTLIEKIEAQHKKLIEANDVFTFTPLCQKFFDYSNKINCVVPFDGGRKLLYGTDSGIYLSEIKKSDQGKRIVSKPIKIISKINVMQLEVLEGYQTFLVLTDKKLLTWPLEILSQTTIDPFKNAKIGKELISHVSFFRVGICNGRMLVCAAKNGSNHIIKVFEPIDPIQQKKLNKRKFKNETKEIVFSSEPVSISFINSRLCVGCTKGFEIVSIEENKMELLLDPADTSLDFVIGKEGLKPLEIDRINSYFLLSYSDFSFYVNGNGWRSRPQFLINWEGLPQDFAIWYPYLLGFDSSFIEIRHVETGDLLRIIYGENIRFLHRSSQEILYAYEDEKGYDVVVSLDFWDKSIKKNNTTTTTTSTTTTATNNNSDEPSAK
ncbi:hypothetical protein PACTADRAFT_48324 [Pachysolen tannophilus NRRL Y-2460]|uniref:CNH domain-containing protein n=1 Tax=Pachysolen tannophilus NRRL Y-2460 TaxID=669874 RepID=A0A1E4U3M4_PACTA|nr:hypothetical protein PACTADRAFT_48324 [Pachysolen tannophilus NRRL Y-2460]